VFVIYEINLSYVLAIDIFSVSLMTVCIHFGGPRTMSFKS